MTAPKWGGPWIGKVAAHGHWETPATVELVLTDALGSVSVENLADSVFGAPAFADFLGSADGAADGSDLYATSGYLEISGALDVPGTPTGAIVSSSLAVSIEGSVIRDNEPIGGSARIVRGDMSGGPGWQSTPFDFTATFNSAWSSPAASNIEDVEGVPVVFRVQTSGTVETGHTTTHHVEVTAVSLTIVYQPPDIWVED